jgi:alpha-D-ribose 1-methylphosphonate 5-triphosphate diphosphatase PhnM
MTTVTLMASSLVLACCTFLVGYATGKHDERHDRTQDLIEVVATMQEARETLNECARRLHQRHEELRPIFDQFTPWQREAE